MLKRLIINGLCILFKYISFLEHEVIPIAFSNRYRALHRLKVWNMKIPAIISY